MAVPEHVSSTPTTRGQFASFRPNLCLQNLSGDFMSDEEGSFHFLRVRANNPLDSTEEESITEAETECVANSICQDPITSFAYIDDYNAIERLCLTNAKSHTTVRKREIKVLAKKSELQFLNVKRVANEINTRVNNKKTQILCIHMNKFANVTSYIDTGDGEILSTDKMKILGFYFDNSPNSICHVTEVINQFYGKLWTLRFLKRSEMDSGDLLKVYKTVIRSAVELSLIHI